MWRAAAVVAVLVVAGCSSESSGDDTVDAREFAEAIETLPACRDLVGEPTPEDPTCDQGDGAIAASTSRDCTDGRTLRWNDGVIGYEGEPAEAYTMERLQDLTDECDPS